MITSYSRRQLYAFGEPLGSNVTRKEGGRIICGGGDEAAPSTQTQISELPEWAKGYAKDTLAKTGALTDINQNPYQTYGANRIAGFNPMQQGAQAGAANMKTSAGTDLGLSQAGAATAGALGTKYDPSTFTAGKFGQADASAYMSPYMQSVVDVQQREAGRAADIATQGRNAQATGAGAFGGSRQAIMDAEAGRNLAMQKGDIQAQGLQSAFGQAQQQFNADQSRNMQAQQLGEQSKQYGAGLGMQGLQTALQGAGQLGALGGQKFGQAMDINKLQSAYGGQQQALEQRGLDQGYQDFQNQQNYPYKQLGFMSDMIRGLPLGQQSTKQMYEPGPGMAQQLGSLGMAGVGLSKFMADGGMAYAGGGGVDSAENVASIVSSLSPQQLQQALKAAKARGDSEQIRAIQDEMGFQASLRSGLAGTVTSGMAERMAGGGAVAFARGGLQDTLNELSTLGDKEITDTPTERQAGITAALPGVQAMYGESALAPMAKEVAADRKALDAKDGIPAEAYFAAARGMLKGRGLVTGLANAGIEGGEAATKAKKEAREASRLLRTSEIQLATAAEQRRDGQIAKAENSYEKGKASATKALERAIDAKGKIATLQSSTENSQRQAAATAASANKKTFEQESVEAKLNRALAEDPSIAKDPIKLAAAKAQAFSDTAKETRAAASIPERIQSAEDLAKGKNDAAALRDATKAVETAKYADPVWRAAKTAKDTAGMAKREKDMITERLPSPAAPAVAPPVPTAGRASASASVGLQARVEQSGQKYEPNKYDYRIAPDGSVQRKAK